MERWTPSNELKWQATILRGKIVPADDNSEHRRESYSEYGTAKHSQTAENVASQIATGDRLTIHRFRLASQVTEIRLVYANTSHMPY